MFRPVQIYRRLSPFCLRFRQLGRVFLVLLFSLGVTCLPTVMMNYAK